MKIQVLGSGCANCRSLYQSVKEVVEKLKLNLEVEYSTDIAEIVSLGAMSSPVLAIDGKLMACGKVLTKEEIEKIILVQLKGGSIKGDEVNKGGCSCGGNC